MHYFIIVGDETSLIGNHGQTKVIAARNRKKHEKILADCRASISMYRTGNCGNGSGPTIFLMAGKKKRTGFSNKFLTSNGAESGSTIIMTETAYMTSEAWEQSTDNVISGIRSMEYVRDNPQWWVLEIFDGVGSHLASLPAMQKRLESKILCLKEEGNSSHVNQVYDRDVAKSDKRAKREALGILRQYEHPEIPVLDQWGLVHVGLYILRGSELKTWQKSFTACNLDPRSRVPFGLWCKKIEHFLQTGEDYSKFNKPLTSKQKYALLPSFWQGMTPVEKKSAMDIMKQGFSVECCIALRDQCFVPVTDQQKLRVCYELALQNPDHLEMVTPEKEPREEEEQREEIVAVAAATKSINEGLTSFQLKPENKRGMDLFDHMLQFRNRDQKIRRTNKNPDDTAASIVRPAPYLDVEFKAGQLSTVQPTIEDLRASNLMRDAGGDGAMMKLAERKLNALGNVNSHSCFVNSAVNLEKMRNQVQLASSIAQVGRVQRLEAIAKKNEETAEKLNLAPTALAKLEKNNGDVEKLTKKEIAAVLLVKYNVTMSESGNKKQKLADALRERMQNKQNDVPKTSGLVNDDGVEGAI